VYGPVIEGERFRLRPPREDDAETMISWFEDLEITARLLRRNPPSLEEEKEWLKKMAVDPSSLIWVIEHEGKAVGTTGLHGIDWVNQRGVTGTLIGDKSVWGKGIAGEMMKKRADFLFTEFNLHKLESGFLEGNEASRRAQLGAGYKEVGRLREQFFREGRWIDHITTELLRDDWEKGRPD
jgi:RimJ/RimL family protein N-acetyltransferase